MKNKNQKVVCAMSGGVDSSVAAALLKKQGYDVVGAFMKFWSEPQNGSARIYADNKADLRGYENRCCSPDSERRARQVAKILKIPFYVFNFEKEFKKRVVDYFLKGYKEGITPNPCVDCNKEIKFGLLLEKALELDADYIATGHYARIRKFVNSKHIRYSLISGKDKIKDQSYFLWQLDQKQLKRVLFPVGDMTKPEVRKLAEKFKLPFKKIPESMEICFVPDKLEDFFKKYIKVKPGIILTADGKKIGQHRGLPFYTIGQRKGIGLSGGPYWVVGKNLKENQLIVSKNEKDLYRKELVAENVNWISGREPKFPLKAKVKIRYRSPSVLAIISKIQNTKYEIQFTQPQRAITSGQSVVFYQGQELLGGGIIVNM